MQLNSLLAPAAYCYRPLIPKLLRVMKLTAIMLFGICLFVSAKGRSQTVSMDLKNVPIQKVFKEVVRQTGISVIYNESMFKDAGKVSIKVKDASVNEVLKKCLEGKPFEFYYENNAIITKPKKVVEQAQTANATAPLGHELRVHVVDTAGQPVVGASVVVRGSKKGIETDASGNAVLTEIEEGDVLVISHVSFIETEVTAGQARTLRVVLESRPSSLDEIVATAYGTSKIKDVTGSIAHVGQADIANAPMGSSVQSLLQGKAAGVNVQIQSASPTSPVSVVIRGASSLTGDNQPLWIIDGVPDYSTSTSGNINNSLYNLNIGDVESIDILKDASATALYGSRAANGVVIVTTKKGKKGMEPTIELTTRFGLQTQDFNDYKYMNAPEYKDFATKAAIEGVITNGAFDYFTRQYLDEQAFLNKNSSEYDPREIHVMKGVYYDGNTNWMDEMTQNPWNAEYDLSLRGGTQSIAYYVSLYSKQNEGIIKSGNSKLYGGRVNLEATLRKGVKFGLNLNASSRVTNDKDYMMEVLKDIRPDIPVYNPDGTLFTRDIYTENPYTTLKNTREGKGITFNGTGFLEFTLSKGLLFRSAYTVNYANNINLTYLRSGSRYYTNGSRTWTNGSVHTNVWENTLTLARTYGKHDILGLLGFSTEKNSMDDYGMAASKFPDDDILNDMGSGTERGELSETNTANSLVSSFARATYKYDNRYIISGTIRRDGSSRFGPDKRWGIFPSGAVAWLISEEKFIKDKAISNTISYLKLRGSIGLTGSQNLGNYDWRTSIGSARYDELPAIAPNSIGNKNLQWEQTRMIDFGLDYGLFGDRIRGTFGLYQKNTTNLIYLQPIPVSTSFQYIYSNVASLKNNGIEFDIKGEIIKKKDLLATLDFNIGHNINRVLKINNASSQLNFPDDYMYYMQVNEGDRTDQWFGYKTANRLFVTQEEVIARQSQTATGAKQYYQDPLENPGDLILLDTNGDGIITEDDKVKLGHADPKFSGGFGATVIYKRFMFNATFTYSYGSKRFWILPSNDVSNVGNYNQSNLIAGQSATLLSPWEATIPRMTMYGYGGNDKFSDYWLYDASYVRLSALNISYRLPEKFFKDFIVQGVDITFQASNLFTWTKYPGFDPQGNWTSSAIGTGMGVDNSIYPAAKNYNLGIKFTFK